MIESTPQIMKGIPVSLSIAMIAILFGLLIGLMIALLRIYRIPVFSQLATIYVSFLRGTPLVVQIFLGYYGILLLFRYLKLVYGIDIAVNEVPAIIFICISLTLCVSAFLSETIRSAILAIPHGQMEAAYSIGMTNWQALRRIILPQALSHALPNFANSSISILKDTSLAFVISVPEIMGQAKIIAGRTSKFLEVYIVAALLYWLICIVLEILLKKLEKAAVRHQRGGAYVNS